MNWTVVICYLFWTVVDMAFCKDYEFIDTVKSKANRSKEGLNLGVLVTHKSMIYWIASYNKDKSKVYYWCSMKKNTGRSS